MSLMYLVSLKMQAERSPMGLSGATTPDLLSPRDVELEEQQPLQTPI